MASRAMIDMGMKKKQRREKGMVDQVAATIMLQEYMERMA
jgi:putative Holliday junction resolvase